MAKSKKITTFSNLVIIDRRKAISYIRKHFAYLQKDVTKENAYDWARSWLDNSIVAFLKGTYKHNHYDQPEYEISHDESWAIFRLKQDGLIDFDVNVEKEYEPKTVFEVLYEEWEAKQPTKFLEEHAKRSQIYVSAGG